jgi:allophanate hydrolase
VTSIGRLFHSATGRKLGALDVPQPQSSPEVSAVADGEIALAVVGAHMSGMPLNRELKEIGARFIEATKTAPIYRLYQLTGPQPHRPGMLRTTNGSGAAIEIELWALPKKSFGQFVAAVAPPLSIGTVSLADGRAVKGFLVESQAVMHAEDITRFRGWRSYMEAREHSSQ